MKRSPLLSLLLLAVTGCTMPAPHHEAAPMELDQMVPIARHKASALFHKTERELWFWAMDCRYYKDWPEQDSTNALRWYTFTFFDPQSVQPSTTGTPGFTAVKYSISLTTNGQYERSSYGRGIGWTQ